jgi:peptidoglycan DL-endopeptidase CwlO
MVSLDPGGVASVMRRALTPLLVSFLLLSALTRPAAADEISDKKAEAARIAKRLAELRQWSGALVEQYNRAQAELSDVNADIERSTAQLGSLTSRSAELSKNAADVAVRSYVLGGATNGAQNVIGQLFVTDGVQRDAYLSVLVGDVADLNDSVEAAAEDVGREQRKLEKAKSRQQKLAADAVSKRKQAEKAIADGNKLLDKTKGDLAELIRAEEERLRLEAEARARREAEERMARERAARAVAIGVRARVTYTGPDYSYPAPSPAAARAVAAAKSQLGVPYVWASERPGISFDCSGLTKWAWGQAGVSMAHYTVSQFNAFPKVPMHALQPGDLVFFGGDLHHMGMYVGGGMMIEAPYTGANVRYSSIHGGDYAGAARPG